MRERGLKFAPLVAVRNVPIGRSREGAWIEMSLLPEAVTPGAGRSREGAWIEMKILLSGRQSLWSLP